MDILGVAFGEQGEVQIEWGEEIESMFFRHAVIVPPGEPDDYSDVDELISQLKSTTAKLLTYVQGDAARAEARPYDNPLDVERRGER